MIGTNSLYFFKVIESDTHDTIDTEYLNCNLTSARAYAIKLFRRNNLKSNGFVSIYEVKGMPSKNIYIGDVSTHHTRTGRSYTWCPDKKWAVYRLNNDGSLGTNYLG